MESGSIFLYLSIFFAILSLCSLFLNELKESGRKALFDEIIPQAGNFVLASFTFITSAAIQLIYYLVSSDFTIQYVWKYTNKDLPAIYKVSALWTGEAGSLMFISWIILFMAYWVFRRYESETRVKRRILIVILLIGTLFLTLTVLLSPFTIMAGNIPEDGAGLNPLLVNKWMILHPPGVFIPYGILVVVFASGLIHLFDKDMHWEIFSRPYARMAWMILGAGMVAGVIWSYEVWENYWIWDPAFTSILMTWILLTAYLHSSSIYRGKMAGILSPALAVNTFILAIYSIYIIRSGAVKSAHSFGEGSKLSLLANFIILITIITEIMVIYRYSRLKQNTKNPDPGLLSNRNIFYVTIILMILLSFIIFWGLTASILLTSYSASISSDLYAAWSYPLTIALITALGICMLEILGKRWVQGIIAGCVIIMAILYLEPSRDIYSNLSISVLTFAGIATIYRLYKSIGSRGMRNKLISCASHVVHFGILVMLAGVLMSTHSTSESIIFTKLYDTKSVGGYDIQLTDLAYPVEHKLTTAVLTKIGIYNIYKDGVKVGSGEARFREIKGEFITEPYIYRGLFSDVNVRYQGIGTRDQIFISVANIRVIPGMTIMWTGSILVIIGIIPLLFKKEEIILNKFKSNESIICNHGVENQ